jgi:hypothetical protein
LVLHPANIIHIAYSLELRSHKDPLLRHIALRQSEKVFESCVLF